MGKSKKKAEERFDASKPQFRKPQEQASKVVLDERFASVLTDPRFQLDVADKYGRSKTKMSVEELSAFYTVKEDEEKLSDKPARGKDDGSASSSDSDAGSAIDETKKYESVKQVEDEKEDEDPASRIAYLTALSRGEIEVSSSSEGDDEDSEDSDDDSSAEMEDPVHGKAGVLDPSNKEEGEVELTNEESPYLAVLNMDWSHVRAIDIFTILSSFTPPGAVKRVQVYPSDFGKERLAKEEMFGPVDVWKKKKKKYESGEEDDQIDPYHSDDDEPEGAEDDRSDEDDDNSDDKEDDVNMQDTDPCRSSIEIAKSDFDPEKLRKYEASRLKYYFAVVQFANPGYADIAYKEVDGMEFEHSSAAVDLRSIPVDGLDEVIKNRDLRDEATSIPSNYIPPEFVVNALQQSSVECTWDMGDRDREKTLTKYTSGQTWRQLMEGDDLKAYLASDHSSDEESDEENEKTAQMRKMLGLDSDDDGNEKQSGDESSSESEDEEEAGAEGIKRVSYVPGKPELTKKLRGNLEPEDEKEELTPWEKYQEKKKQKRRDKRQASREKRKEVTELRKRGGTREKPVGGNDDFSMDRSNVATFSSKQTKEDLELLVAGDDNEEETRDFDMRGLERLEKNKDKKLRGARKRKEDKLAANVTGTEFKVDTSDERFKAVLEGTDDRFGIDRTDPNFKETPAMREILAEQTSRRKKKRKTGDSTDHIAPDVSAEVTKPSSGSAALSALVSSIKSRVYQ